MKEGKFKANLFINSKLLNIHSLMYRPILQVLKLETTLFTLSI